MSLEDGPALPSIGVDKNFEREGASAGSTAGGGFSLQAVVGAFVAAHIIASEPLGWLELEVPDVPMALAAETSGPGDDYRIEFESGAVAEVQVKGGLKGGARLRSAVAALVRGLSADSNLQGVLVVDEEASHPVRVQFRGDLERLAGGRDDNLYAITRRVLAHLDALGLSRAALQRLSVVVVGRDQLDSVYRQHAVQLISRALEDRSWGPAAWGVLAHEALRLVATRGRRDRQRWLRLLGSRRFPIRATGEMGSLPAAAGTPPERISVMATVPVDGGTESNPAEDGPWLPRIETARDLQKQGAAASALRILEGVRAGIDGSSASASLRARVHNNIGAALTSLHRAEEAIDSFQRALDYRPRDPLFLANLAQAEMVVGRRADALRHATDAVAADPLSTIGWSVRIQTSDVPGLEEIPPALQNDPQILVARAMVATDEGEALLREALRHGPRDPQILVLLAETLYSSLHPRRPSDPVPSDTLAEMERLGREAATLLESSDDRWLHARALLMQGAAADFRGVDGDGAPFFERAVQVAPDYTRARYAAARAKISSGDPATALYLIDSIPGSARSGWAAVLRATVLVELGRAAEIDDDVRIALRGDEDGSDLTAMAHQLGALVVGADRGDLAEPILAALAAGGQPEWAHLFRARAAARGGERSAAESEYRAAIAAADSAVVGDIRIELASYLDAEDEHAAANELYEAAGAAGRGGLALKMFSRNLYVLGRLDRLAEVLEEVRAQGEPPTWALDLESRIALNRDDIPGAIRALRRLIAQSPTDVEARLRLGYALLRERERAEAWDVLGPLDERSDLDVYDSVRLAQLLVEVGRSERALVRAYRALREVPDDPELHVACLGVLHRSDRGDFDRDVVGPDTWVKLQADGRPEDTVEYLILSEGPVDLRRNERLASDPHARALMGLREGDAITLREGTVTERAYRVVELKSALLHVFHDTMLNFEERFPGRTEIQMAHVGHGESFDPAPFVALVSRGTQAIDDVLDEYRQKQLPIGVLSTGGTQSLRRTYVQLLYDPEAVVFVEEPDRAVIDASRRAACHETVVLTATALATLQELGLLELLPRAYPRIIAPRSLLDELDSEVAEWEQFRDNGGYASATIADHALSVVRIGVEFVDAEIRRVRELRDFVDAHASVEPRPLTARDPEQVELRGLIGESSYDAQALAGGEVALYADDLGLMRMARHVSQVPGFSTYALLRMARDRRLLSEEEFHRCTAQLVLLGHVAVPISADLLIHAIRSSGYDLSLTVRRLFDALADPVITVESAVLVVVGVLRELAVAPLGRGALGSITSLALDVLTREREVRPVVRRFRGLVRGALKVLPLQQDIVQERIDTFVRVRGIERD